MVLYLQACALCVCLCACLPACSCFVWAHIFHLRLNVTEIHKQTSDRADGCHSSKGIDGLGQSVILIRAALIGQSKENELPVILIID